MPGTSEDPKAPRGVHSLQQRSHRLPGSRAAVSQNQAGRLICWAGSRARRTWDSAQDEWRPWEASSLEGRRKPASARAGVPPAPCDAGGAEWGKARDSESAREPRAPPQTQEQTGRKPSARFLVCGIEENEVLTGSGLRGRTSSAQRSCPGRGAKGADLRRGGCSRMETGRKPPPGSLQSR